MHSFVSYGFLLTKLQDTLMTFGELMHFCLFIYLFIHLFIYILIYFFSFFWEGLQKDIITNKNSAYYN